MNKGFFSSVILVLIVIILLFFVTISSSTKPIMFSDLPRYAVLSSEEAYSMLDKQLFSSFRWYEKKVGKCGVIPSDVQEFKDYLNDQNFDTKNCNNTISSVDLIVDKNVLKGKIISQINCTLKNDIEEYVYSKTFTFNKQYESAPIGGGNCSYVFIDLDADYIYYHG